MSTVAVLHTPVTSAPKALAICTAKVPTPAGVPSACVLGEGGLGDTEHLVAHMQRRHGLADRFYLPSDLPASHAGLGRTVSVSSQAHG